jgi:predicted acetyltransferase
MRIRRYQDAVDLESAIRIWREVGWIEEEKRHEQALATFLSGSEVWLAELRDTPECLVATMPGTVMYLNRELKMRAVTAVTTSRVARRQGLASRLTAHALADSARNGAIAAFLGVFDQGFYDRLGFGTGSYERLIAFDPAALAVEGRAGVPHRLSADQAAAVHEARLGRMRWHGSCNIDPTEFTRAEMVWNKNGFGLGYVDPDGRITHHLWATAKGENGPYRIEWLSYQNTEQFLELLRLVKGLADQVYAVRMQEPGWVQLQDLLDQPFRRHATTRRSEMENSYESYAYWQVRILDLEKAMAVTSLPGMGQISFNLQLEDPVARYLDESDGWTGASGQYVVTLGEVSHARPGQSSSLPTMRATVNAFSRLWFGTASALALSVSGGLDAPTELLTDLSRVLCMPKPSLDWIF